MDQDETNNLLSMTQNGRQPSGSQSKFAYDLFRQVALQSIHSCFLDLIPLCLQDTSAEVWQLSGANPNKTGGEGVFGHGVFVADHIKAKSRGGRLPDWKDCAVDMIAKGSSLGFVFLI